MSRRNGERNEETKQRRVTKRVREQQYADIGSTVTCRILSYLQTLFSLISIPSSITKQFLP